MKTIEDFLVATKDDILEYFISAVKHNDEYYNYTVKNDFPRYLYIPGKRADRVLLVAHIDTVWGNNIPKISNRNGVLYNSDIETLYTNTKKLSYDSSGFGIGADDRVGCYILSELLDSGHSIFLNEYEEIHLGQLINSRDPQVREFIMSHKFAMEFDRWGNSDLCFYNKESDTFRDYIVSSFPGYKDAVGVGSDISELCLNLIPAVNLSCGYYRAHTPYEYVKIEEVENVLSMTKEFLKNNQSRWTI